MRVDEHRQTRLAQEKRLKGQVTVDGCKRIPDDMQHKIWAWMPDLALCATSSLLKGLSRPLFDGYGLFGDVDDVSASCVAEQRAAESSWRHETH